MSKSAIYMADTSSNGVSVGDAIPLGGTQRRYGCNLLGNGDAVAVRGIGYYLVSLSATVAPTAAGTATVALMRNSLPVPGASASVTATASSQPQTLAITAVVREVCGAEQSSLSFQLSGADSVVSNTAVSVVKL